MARSRAWQDRCLVERQVCKAMLMAIRMVILDVVFGITEVVGNNPAVARSPEASPWGPIVTLGPKTRTTRGKDGWITSPNCESETVAP